MILRDTRIALSATETVRSDLTIDRGKVKFGVRGGPGPELRLPGFLILPGLINAHDHLEFNLFPRLGRGPYPNAAEWANDIHHPDAPPVREQLQVPKAVRLFWGGIKNLICGITSVLHHNPYDPVFDRSFPVRVIRRFGWSHSLAFSRDVAFDWKRTPPGAPFIIHACEGTDARSAREVHQLNAAGALGAATVLVHGVALDQAGVSLAKRAGASVIWCPSSNRFMLGRTLSREAFDSGIPIALGTDSALTADGDLLDEIEAATLETDSERLYSMLTGCAARILRLGSGAGEICDGGAADLVIVRDSGGTPADSLRSLKPEMVLIGGHLKLISHALATRIPGRWIRRFQPLEVAGRARCLIDCDVSALFVATRRVLGDGFRLAGKAVAV